MTSVEILEALTELSQAPFDPAEFPFQFLAAFDNKETTLQKLRKGASNLTDVENAVLQRNNIHLAVSELGQVPELLGRLKSSPKTNQAKAKFVFVTDGEWFEAEDLASGEPVSDRFENLPNHVGFFLPLAGITTVKEIKDNPIDIRATSRLNKLYVELLKDNPDWATEAKRPDLNHFLARLIFCFFAEDTDIFKDAQFTRTVDLMTSKDGSDTHLVLEQIFRAMNIDTHERLHTDLPPYAREFRYVNGGLFSGSAETPKFSRIARSYLIRAGELNWREINPDIFGSMIQAVADDEERGSLGMHYTSVPNILKVLNPLFLDDLREQLERAGEHKPSLLKLRERMSKIRVFDPACGSGNFLVIAYKEMRAIEGEINRRRNEIYRDSEIYLTNFRGIEIRSFAAEIARLALLIAEFQCDVLYRGPQLALKKVLPLDKQNWIVCENALRLDWTRVCPPSGKEVSIVSTAEDLFETPLDQPRIEFKNEGGETYICGNPPYMGSSLQTPKMKAEIKEVLKERCQTVGVLDYVSGWFVKAVDYSTQTTTKTAFVTTNSICQGQSVSALWPVLFSCGAKIDFAYTSFKWNNLATANAGVTVAIIGLTNSPGSNRNLYQTEKNGELLLRSGHNISPYLTIGDTIIVSPAPQPIGIQSSMDKGNQPTDGGNLLLDFEEVASLGLTEADKTLLVRTFLGSQELIQGKQRFCLWIEDHHLEIAKRYPAIADRLNKVRQMRLDSPKLPTQKLAEFPHRFGEIRQTGNETLIAVPSHSSEERPFLPCALLPPGSIVSNACFAIYDAPLWNLALIASRLHLVWIATVCGKLKTDFRYSNTLGWNTFPVPTLTEQNKADLTQCAEEILLARERHFPKTIADLYDPENMPDDLRRAHELNDETLERIYIGRRFKNDTERLEKLFEMYAKMTAANGTQQRNRRAN